MPEETDSSAAWTSFSSDQELYASIGGGGDGGGGGIGGGGGRNGGGGNIGGVGGWVGGDIGRTSSAGTTPAPPVSDAYSELV